MRTNFRGAFATLVRGIPATLLLIVANVAVFAALLAIDSRAADEQRQVEFLAHWGANLAGLTLTGEPWRLLTSMFLHAGGLHLAFNCLALLEIGGVVERRLGSLRTLAIYLLAGLGGALASALWNDFALSVGASGAIFGLLAALIVLGFLSPRRLRGPYGDPVSPGRALFFGALTLAMGLFFNFDNAAHVGGFAAGGALSLIALLAERARRRSVAAVVFGLAVLAAGTAVASLSAHAYRPDAAARLHFAQLLQALRDGNAGAGVGLRRCALQSASAPARAPAEVFAACLGRAAGQDGTPASRNDTINRFMLELERNQREVWPRCRRRADAQLRHPLDVERRAVVEAALAYCEARQRLEGSLLQDEADTAPDAAWLRPALLRFEVVAALAEGQQALPLQALPDPDQLRRQAATLARWQASLSEDERELARLGDCPATSCRRGWAR